MKIYKACLPASGCLPSTTGWYKSNVLTQVPERGTGLKVTGKFLFIGIQAGANQTSVGEGKAKLLHFLFGSFCGPVLFGHAVGCNHHQRLTIILWNHTPTR